MTGAVTGEVGITGEDGLPIAVTSIVRIVIALDRGGVMTVVGVVMVIHGGEEIVIEGLVIVGKNFKAETEISPQL